MLNGLRDWWLKTWDWVSNFCSGKFYTVILYNNKTETYFTWYTRTIPTCREFRKIIYDLDHMFDEQGKDSGLDLDDIHEWLTRVRSMQQLFTQRIAYTTKKDQMVSIKFTRLKQLTYMEKSD